MEQQRVVSHQKAQLYEQYIPKRNVPPRDCWMSYVLSYGVGEIINIIGDTVSTFEDV